MYSSAVNKPDNPSNNPLPLLLSQNTSKKSPTAEGRTPRPSPPPAAAPPPPGMGAGGAEISSDQQRMIMQVLSLSQETIDSLPPDQRATILQLRSQFMNLPPPA
ncbi:hypothetical protein NMY22_g3912 [Coprinellus aureogranulatus]|nr:hypothetical protein NMY22_g3912 [Coprinellus aureogranulatus]